MICLNIGFRILETRQQGCGVSGTPHVAAIGVGTGNANCP